MGELPDSIAVASGFAAASPAEVHELLADLSRWPTVFPDWIASVVQDDDRFTATGPGREKFDLYAHPDAEAMALDVEVVDELGSADTMRIRVVDAPGGSVITASHGKLMGMPEAAWAAKRDGVAAGLRGLAVG